MHDIRILNIEQRIMHIIETNMATIFQDSRLHITLSHKTHNNIHLLLFLYRNSNETYKFVYSLLCGSHKMPILIANDNKS